ncbi:MAG: hypothetical protein AB9Q17_07210 [Candidatus Reddybacter sp.]
MKKPITEAISDTAYVAAGMLVCGAIYSIVYGECVLAKRHASYLLVILPSYFAVNLVLQKITKNKKAANSNGST